MEEFFKYMRIFSRRKTLFHQPRNIGVLAEIDPFTGSERDKNLLHQFIILNKSRELSVVKTTDHDAFSSFVLVMTPNEGYYKGGTFRFLFKLPANYKQQPPVVRCMTKIWHPNIAETGEIRAAILESQPGENWGLTRDLSDVVAFLEKMLTDVRPTTNALNTDACYMLLTKTQMFRVKAALYVWMYARGPENIPKD